MRVELPTLCFFRVGSGGERERKQTTKEMTKEIEHQILPPIPKGQDAIYFGSFFFPLSWIPNAHE